MKSVTIVYRDGEYTAMRQLDYGLMVVTCVPICGQLEHYLNRAMADVEEMKVLDSAKTNISRQSS